MLRRWEAWARSSRGALIAHPVALLALAALVLNDHVLKTAWPGAITGKISDFAGLAFFPALLVSLAEVVLNRPRTPGRRRSLLLLAIGVTGFVFVVIKDQPNRSSHRQLVVRSGAMAFRRHVARPVADAHVWSRGSVGPCGPAGAGSRLRHRSGAWRTGEPSGLPTRLAGCPGGALDCRPRVARG